jgi:hypothetical protein
MSRWQGTNTVRYVDEALDEVDRLLVLLDQTAAYLRDRGHTLWADWVRVDRARIADHDAYGLEHLLAAFGGMGSINDLMDDKLDPLLTGIFTSAIKILHDLR